MTTIRVMRGRPGDEPDADSFTVRGAELLIDPLGIAVRAADETKPAGSGDRRREGAPATKAIGAEMIGWRMPSASVNRFASALTDHPRTALGWDEWGSRPAVPRRGAPARRFWENRKVHDHAYN